MKITDAAYLKSVTDYKQCPPSDKPEYAFIGRSNVGKSSLINTITNHPKLAKVSQVPGKTQTINHFLINQAWYLVDLPGYGWAKVSQANKAKWEGMIRSYLQNRPNLLCVFVLIDSRLPAQPIDLSFMEWLGQNGIPFVMVFTKADKQSKNQTLQNISAYEKKMLETWAEMPSVFITSSFTKEGGEPILDFIADLNTQFATSDYVNRGAR